MYIIVHELFAFNLVISEASQDSLHEKIFFFFTFKLKEILDKETPVQNITLMLIYGPFNVNPR